MLLVSYIQQYTSITVLTNQVWKLLIALFKVLNTGQVLLRYCEAQWSLIKALFGLDRLSSVMVFIISAMFHKLIITVLLFSHSFIYSFIIVVYFVSPFIIFPVTWPWSSCEQYDGVHHIGNVPRIHHHHGIALLLSRTHHVLCWFWW